MEGSCLQMRCPYPVGTGRFVSLCHKREDFVVDIGSDFVAGAGEYRPGKPGLSTSSGQEQDF